MGILICQRCKAKIECDSVEGGRKLLNHSVGLYIGKPCQDGKAELIFTGKEKPIKTDKKHTKSKKE